MSTILTYILIGLCVVIVILLIILLAGKPQQNNSSDILEKQIEITAKKSYNQLNDLSKQMNGLTEKKDRKSVV